MGSLKLLETDQSSQRHIPEFISIACKYKILLDIYDKQELLPTLLKSVRLSVEQLEEEKDFPSSLKIQVSKVMNALAEYLGVHLYIFVHLIVSLHMLTMQQLISRMPNIHYL